MVIIHGNNSVFGSVNISGAKNAALPLLVAASLCSEDVRLNNMPVELNDVKVLISILNKIGYKIETYGHSVIVYNSQVSTVCHVIPEEASKIRYSLLLLPLLLLKTGKVMDPIPGGCKLGDRKYDIHIESLNKLGAIMTEDDEHISGILNKGFIGNSLKFHIATTSGSESAILAAVWRRGKLS